MDKMLVFDMDGTLGNFYSVDGWLEYLHNSDPYPYKNADPLYDMENLNIILNALKFFGWKIIITSWLAMNSTKEFDNTVRTAKKEWLARYNFPYDEIHLVKYGRTKADCTRAKQGYQILIDDNEKIRNGWTLGATIDANTDIIKPLLKILNAEIVGQNP